MVFPQALDILKIDQRMSLTAGTCGLAEKQEGAERRTHVMDSRSDIADSVAGGAGYQLHFRRVDSHSAGNSCRRGAAEHHSGTEAVIVGISPPGFLTAQKEVDRSTGFGGWPSPFFVFLTDSL